MDRRWIDWRLLVVAAVAGLMGGATVVGLQRVSAHVKESVFRNEANDMWFLYRAWRDQGKPTGLELQKFANSFKANNSSRVSVAAKAIDLGETNFTGLFSCESRVKSGELYVTTQGAVIWKPETELLFTKQ